jgi:signal transduction histidine kinase
MAFANTEDGISLFVDALKGGRPERGGFWRGSAEVAELARLAGRFLGAERARKAFADYARHRGLDAGAELPADARTVTFAETLLAGAIGSASARVMVASVTHELRTPLASIRAFSEILQNTPDIEPEERQHFIGIIVSETERLTRLVNQVLDLAKIESGAADWRTERVDLAQIIRESEEATGQLFREKGAKIQLDLPAGPADLWADRDRLIQVMLNLLSNAAKFVPQGTGRAQVRLEANPTRYLVSVTDNGPGIPADELPVIFEKFRQGSDGHAKPVGTGLGLPISRRIVERLGGRIWAESETGKGATFSFVLPRNEGSGPADESSRQLGAEPGGSRPGPPSTANDKPAPALSGGAGGPTEPRP